MWEYLTGAIYTILGGLISGLIGLLLEARRRRREEMNKHFENIKEECLMPLREELPRIRQYFEYGEFHPPNPYYIDEILRDEIRWWDCYTFRNNLKINKALYDDLGNHFPELIKMLTDIERDIRTTYSELLKAERDLYALISKDEELSKQENREVVHAAYFIAIGLDKSFWPNIYRKLADSGLINKALSIGQKYFTLKEAETIRRIMAGVQNRIDTCIYEIEKILQQTRLRGKCRFLS